MKKLIVLCVLLMSGIANADTYAENAYNAGLKAYDNREYQNAIYAFQNAINDDANYYKAYYMLGLSYILNNDKVLGEKSLLNTINAFPIEWKTYVLLAEYYTTDKNYDKAIFYYEKAFDLYTMPQSEINKYQKKLTAVQNLRRETWMVSEAEKKAILSHISVPISMTTWRAALVEKSNSNTHVAYALKTDDYLGGDWSESLDISCTETPELNNFNAINEWLAQYYRKMNAGLDTVEEGENSRLFEIIVQKPKMHIIGQIFPVNGGYCISQYMKKKPLKPDERTNWIAEIKKIKIH